LLSLVGTLLAWLLLRKAARDQVTIRSLWTLSFLLFVTHVVSSFHFVHHWSHHQAYIATAEETKRLLGVEFGGGVYFNYLFLLGWAVHVWFSWRPAPQKNLVVRGLLHVILIYMLFIAFNGVVVFKSGWLRALGITATCAVTLAAAYNLASPKRRLESASSTEAQSCE
jgi:hypothetical protein